VFDRYNRAVASLAVLGRVDISSGNLLKPASIVRYFADSAAVELAADSAFMSRRRRIGKKLYAGIPVRWDGAAEVAVCLFPARLDEDVATP
jgi:hypothetical protein